MKALVIALVALFAAVNAQAQTWVQVPATTNRNFYDCWFDPANPSHGALTGWYMVAWDQYSFVYSTDDGGATLTPQDVLMGGLFLAAQSITYTNSTTGYVAGTGVLKTMDGGLHWYSSLDFGLAQGKFTDIRFASPDSGYVVGEGWYGPTSMFFKTTNAGLTWTQHDPSGGSTALTCLARPSSHALYAGATNTAGRTLYKSTNDGNTWVAMNTYDNIYSLCFSSPTTGLAGTTSAILRTADGGLTWTSVLSASGNVNRIELVGSEGLAVTSTGWIFHTTDGGISWASQPSPVQGSAILYDVCMIGTSYAYAVGSGGTILKYGSPAEVGNGREPGRTIVEVRPAEPNPFVAHTTIRYALPEAAPVALRLYDGQGRLVRVLAYGVQSAGWHAVDIAGENLGRGVYHFRLQANGRESSGKIVHTR